MYINNNDVRVLALFKMFLADQKMSLGFTDKAACLENPSSFQTTFVIPVSTCQEFIAFALLVYA